MAEHYFPLKIPINSNTTTSCSNPGLNMGRFQRSDVPAAPRAHTSDVPFYKFQFQPACYDSRGARVQKCQK